MKKMTLQMQSQMECDKQTEQCLTIMSGNEIFGFEDMLTYGDVRSCSVVCASQIGKLYALDHTDVKMYLFMDDIIKKQMLEMKTLR